jgi:mono/diheme cytochrome c family protein
MIAAGDPVAVGLFQQFKSQRMPDWSDLSEKQIEAMLDWLAASGPEREADERGAETAGDDEVEEGRRLFHGLSPIANGGAACAGCHSMKDARDSGGGALGPDLSHAYTDLRDRAITSLLKRPCFPRLPESMSAVFLTPSESFALKSYLRSTALAAEGGTP